MSTANVITPFYPIAYYDDKTAATLLITAEQYS